MKFILFIVLFIGFLASAWSQKVTMSVLQAQEMAVESNRNAKNAVLAVDEANWKRWESIAAGLPQVNATVDYNHFLGANAQLFGQTVEFNPTSNFSITASQLVFSGNYWVGIQLADLAKSLTNTQKRKVDHQLRIDVANAYYLALVAQKSRDLIASNLSNLKEIHQKTKLSAEVGIIEPTDLDQLTVQVGTLENNLRAVERQIELAYNILRMNIGLGVDSELELTDSLEAVLSLLVQDSNAIQSYDMQNNLDFQLMASQLQMAEKQVRLQQSAALPTLSAFYQYTEKLKKPEFDMSPKNVVGLNLSIPIFSSCLRHAKVKQARIQHEKMENSKALLWDQLLIQEKQARFNLVNAWDQYHNQNDNLSVSQQVFHMISLKYEQGLVSGIDLITANNNYVMAQNNYVNSVLQLLQAGLELERLYNEE